MPMMQGHQAQSLFGLSLDVWQGLGIGLALGAVVLLAVTAFLMGRAGRPSVGLSALAAGALLLFGAAFYLAIVGPGTHDMAAMEHGGQMGMGGGMGGMGGGMRGGMGGGMGGTPTGGDPSAVAVGQELFAVHCVSCHGETGVGDGPLASALPIRPANILEHLGHHPDSELEEMIVRGIPPAMPPMGINEEEARRIVQYMRTMGTLPGDHLH